MKLLKKMLLINWHYINKQMIEFENTNFLTGKNGAGKSTILDALQLLILGDTRGTFFNKAANDKAGRSLEGYLKGEIGDDGDTGYKYLRNDRFTSYIVCEFYDSVARKEFCVGVIFDVYKDSDTENHFFYINGKIPENEFIGDNNVPFEYKDFKSFIVRKYGNKNFEIYNSNKQYQEAIKGRFGSLNQKFFNLFKKAVTFTPIDDIEKFIVEYICDVKNKIDITSMQENIRQYNNLSKQVKIMRQKESELDEIEAKCNLYISKVSQENEEQYLIWRAEKQIFLDELEHFRKKLEEKKRQKENIEKEVENLKIESQKLTSEIEDLIETRAKSDVEAKRKEFMNKITEIKDKVLNIENLEKNTINSFRNHNLIWDANISNLESIKNKIEAKEIDEIGKIKDLLKYIDSINENNFVDLEINAILEIKIEIEKLIAFGNQIFFKTKNENELDVVRKNQLEKEISILEKGKNPYEAELLNLKTEIENRLNIKTYILADLLEIRDKKWQNAIEGYLNSQKKYLIVEPEFFEKASKIYRELSNNNRSIHSFGIIDIEKIKKENKLIIQNSLAEEIITKNEFARVYIDYLLGRVIKCETISELRENKISITSDCMLYQGYVLRKINPQSYMYPIIGKEALKEQKEIKEKELVVLKQKVENEEIIMKVMSNLKQMSNFSEDDILTFSKNKEESKKKEEYNKEKDNIQKELDSMDMFWLNSITEKIELKESLKNEKENLKIEKVTLKEGLRKDIEVIENEKIPRLQEEINAKIIEIDERYTKQWQEESGEERFGKETLKRIPEKIYEIFMRNIKSTVNKKEIAKQELIEKRREYITKYQLSYNILDDNNKEFEEELKKLKEIDLPEYSEKIDDSRSKAYEQFRIEFLDKLKSNIDEVKLQIKDLNNALSTHKFGKDTYSFTVSPKEEYKRFYNMITDDMLLGDWAIGQEQFNQKYAQEIKELFDKVTTTDINESLISTEQYEKNIKEYTDYRTYLKFDLIVKDEKGNSQRLSKTLLKKSGGETQTPFYISILASFAQVYRIKGNENTIRLIVFDEAFSKMDSERIEESIKLLKRIGFQSIFAAPPEKIQDIQELVDTTLLVLNPEEHNIVVQKYVNKEKW